MRSRIAMPANENGTSREHRKSQRAGKSTRGPVVRKATDQASRLRAPASKVRPRSRLVRRRFARRRAPELCFRPLLFSFLFSPLALPRPISRYDGRRESRTRFQGGRISEVSRPSPGEIPDVIERCPSSADFLPPRFPARNALVVSTKL